MRKLIASNKVAKRDYQIIETIESGIQLKGAEVKSLRAGRTSLKNSFAKIENGQVYIYNLHISPYEYSTSEDIEPKRIRKLLLHKKQTTRLLSKTQEKGLTLIPLSIYITHGLIKIELALTKGKREFDKREKIKRKTAEREMLRGFNSSPLLRFAAHP